MDFKEEWNWLNSYQMEAVTDENDACIVNANVGSGKTTVLIAKILYLHYEKKIPLEKMVVLTFTNKAAGEIIERLKKKEPGLTEEQVQFFGTFHSVAMRMLKNTLLQAKAENGYSCSSLFFKRFLYFTFRLYSVIRQSASSCSSSGSIISNSEVHSSGTMLLFSTV